MNFISVLLVIVFAAFAVIAAPHHGHGDHESGDNVEKAVDDAGDVTNDVLVHDESDVGDTVIDDADKVVGDSRRR